MWAVLETMPTSGICLINSTQGSYSCGCGACLSLCPGGLAASPLLQGHQGGLPRGQSGSCHSHGPSSGQAWSHPKGPVQPIPDSLPGSPIPSLTNHLELIRGALNAPCTLSPQGYYTGHSLLLYLANSCSSFRPQLMCPFLQEAFPDHLFHPGEVPLLCVPAALASHTVLQ